MKDALTDLLQQAKSAQAFVEEKGKSEIKKVAKSFVSDMGSLIDQYARHVVTEVCRRRMPVMRVALTRGTRVRRWSRTWVDASRSLVL